MGCIGLERGWTSLKNRAGRYNKAGVLPADNHRAGGDRWA